MRGRPEPTRARAIVLAAALVLAAAALGACGDDEGSDATTASSAEAGESQTLEAFVTEDFEAADANGDGALDETESDAEIKQDFEDTDADGDGVLTIDDVQQELDDTNGGKAGQPLSAYLPYDSDDDGEITEQEYADAIAGQITEPMDADSDGEVTVEEAVAFHEAAAGGKGGK